MPRIDYLAQFSSNQETTTGTSSVTYDTGADNSSNPASNQLAGGWRGGQFYVELTIETAGATSGQSLQIDIRSGSSATDLTADSPVTHATKTLTVDAGELAAGQIHLIPVDFTKPPKRYVGLYYTASGTLTEPFVNAHLVCGVPVGIGGVGAGQAGTGP